MHLKNHGLVRHVQSSKVRREDRLAVRWECNRAKEPRQGGLARTLVAKNGNEFSLRHVQRQAIQLPGGAMWRRGPTEAHFSQADLELVHAEGATAIAHFRVAERSDALALFLILAPSFRHVQGEVQLLGDVVARKV